MREKYEYLEDDYAALLSILYEADGQFGMARSEISYQGEGDVEEPDMWHAAYSARMRPLAFPGEWAGYSAGTSMTEAFSDAAPYMAGGSLLGFLGGGMGTPEPNDLLRMLFAAQGLNNENVDGLPR